MKALILASLLLCSGCTNAKFTRAAKHFGGCVLQCVIQTAQKETSPKALALTVRGKQKKRCFIIRYKRKLLCAYRRK